MSFLRGDKRFCSWKKVCALGLLGCLCTGALAGQEIRGTVRNQTHGGAAAAGDAVILLRPDQSMQEVSRTTADAGGAFALGASYSKKPYLVRVIHQGVEYDEIAEPGVPVFLHVFDSASQVRAITGSIEILRAATNGNLLHVSDLFEIRNESEPPVTQAGPRTFEAYLPENAKIDSVLAAELGKMAKSISAAPVPDEPGHFTVSFPLRPGATKLAFNYDLPYKGRRVFHPWLAYPLKRLVIMIPQAMKFSSRAFEFQLLASGNSHYEVHSASQLQAGNGPEFEVSGMGALPLQPSQDQSPARTASILRPEESHPGNSLSIPSRAGLISPFPKAKAHSVQVQTSSESITLGLLTVILLAGSGFLISRRRQLLSGNPPRGLHSATGNR